jgi:MIP family channel proteins
MSGDMSRRYLAELIGTFGIVFAPVALSASGRLPGGDSSLAAAAWVSGLSVMAMIYSLGHISAAHFNPAVTLAFAVAKRFPSRYVLPYWRAQFAGGILAACASRLLFGVAAGAHTPGPEIGRALGLEVALAFMLMSVIISVATDRRVNGAIPGIAIGLTVVIGVWIGGPVTGGSMNPARSLGPALFAGGEALSGYFVYLLGPPIGAVMAALLYEGIRGGREHALGAPNDLYVAMSEVARSAE